MITIQSQFITIKKSQLTMLMFLIALIFKFNRLLFNQLSWLLTPSRINLISLSYCTLCLEHKTKTSQINACFKYCIIEILLFLNSGKWQWFRLLSNPGGLASQHQHCDANTDRRDVREWRHWRSLKTAQGKCHNIYKFNKGL